MASSKLSLYFYLVLFLANGSCVLYRIPQRIVPTFYDLSLTIDPEDNHYTGSVNITLRTSNDTNEIYIHQDGDSIIIGSFLPTSNDSTATLNNNVECKVGAPSVSNVALIQCSRALVKDEDNFLYLEFKGNFSLNDGYGLVKNQYKDEVEQSVLIASNFKPIYARRAFPCLDEPEFKSNFSLRVTHPKNYTALSNGPVVDVSLSESSDYQTTKFATTPEISTYMLSILVSDFQQLKTSPENSLDFKILSRPGVVTSANTSIAETYYHKIIQKLDEYTGVPYQDLGDTGSYLVALPDYSESTGEFGLFTYRESDLLDEGAKTAKRVKQDIVTSMTYKLSHEWYGGDVATKWWSDVWANEAVATYFKYMLTNEIDDSLDLKIQFLLEVTQKALQNDAYPFALALSSHDYSIKDDWSVEQQLYSGGSEKGASILYMINLILGGNEEFQRALQSHFRKREGQPTDGVDILKDLLENKPDYDGMSYYDCLEKWISSPGYPLLTVHLEKSNFTDVATLTQSQFSYPTSDARYKSWWNIPLSSATANNNPSIPHFEAFFRPDDDMEYIFGGGDRLIFNGQTGYFYRVNYDKVLWLRILKGLKTERSSFQELQRAQLIDDIFNIARVGEIDYTMVFQLTEYLVNETEYSPWYSAFNAFDYLLGKMGNEDIETNLKVRTYVLNLMEHLVVISDDKYIQDSDSHVDVLKKVMVLEWACKLGHEECIKYTTGKFDSYKKSRTSLEDYNTRRIVLCNGIRHSNNVNEDWDFLWSVYNSSSTSVHERNDILGALGCAEDRNLLQSYLRKLVIDNSVMNKQYVLTVFKSVFSSSLGLSVSMDFLLDQINAVYRFYNDIHMVSDMLYTVADKLTTYVELTWLDHVLNSAALDDYKVVKMIAKTRAEVNNYWQDNFRSGVTELFGGNSTSTTTEISTTNTEKTNPTTESTGERASLSIFLLFVAVSVILFEETL
ncbi:hypothetical protein NQ315_003110 [Exocentrus adspersus]|uniref:Aminopeptidase n=1 Tax=Exocentrus adspersus TaxID=1586481 RepID=A0AAV8W592_9CUCU|nr:hypothetical protein NQ315_003110 [Exocentrus adspersus]